MSHPGSEISEEEDSGLDSETMDEPDASGSDYKAEGETSAEPDEDDYGEWRGFGQSSEADEDPAPGPPKLHETTAAALTPQPGSKYVPPHLRKAAADIQSQPSESLVKLTKRLNGLLNRYAARPLLLALALTRSPV